METKLKDMKITCGDYTLEIEDGWMEAEGLYDKYESLTQMFAAMARKDDHTLDTVLEEMTKKGANWNRISAHCRREIKDGVDLEEILDRGDFGDEGDCEFHFESWNDRFFENPQDYINGGNNRSISDKITRMVWDKVCDEVDIRSHIFIDEWKKELTDTLKYVFTFKTEEELLSSLEQLYEDELKSKYEDFVEDEFYKAIKRVVKEMMQVHAK